LGAMTGQKKKGPCYHCGVAESPMWRKGPEDKPVLCNACGARWLTKRTLEGYLPKSAGGTRTKRVKMSSSKPKASSKSASGKGGGGGTRRPKMEGSSRRNASEDGVASNGKRKRKVPQKYKEHVEQRAVVAKGKGKKASSNAAGSARGRKVAKRGNLRIELDENSGKVLDRIPSPQKPAKKRHTVRNLFVDDLASPRTTVPPKKKKHDLLLAYPYKKHSVLKSFESPLCHVDLFSIIKESTLDACLSKEDKDVLAAMLPDVDVAAAAPGQDRVSFSNCFKSEAFRGAVLNFQDLLKSGSFDPEFPTSNLRMVDHYKRLTKEVDLSKWSSEAPTSTSQRTRGAPAALPNALQDALTKMRASQAAQEQPKVEVAVVTQRTEIVS